MPTLTRDEALSLLQAATLEPHLMQHALAAEAVLRALAQRLDQDIEMWGLCGLLHDLDYAQTAHTPEKHGLKSATMLAGQLPKECIAAIRAHNGEMNGHSPQTQLDYALRCGETVTGLVVTAALVRPTGITGMEPKSLKKKMKDKAFAASVNRETIRQCAELGLELDEFLQLSITAMETQATALGLPTGA